MSSCSRHMPAPSRSFRIPSMRQSCGRDRLVLHGEQTADRVHHAACGQHVPYIGLEHGARCVFQPFAQCRGKTGGLVLVRQGRRRTVWHDQAQFVGLHTGFG